MNNKCVLVTRVMRSFVLSLAVVAVNGASIDARPVAARSSDSKAGLASLLGFSRAKPLDAAKDKILPRGGNDFLGMTGKALDEATSAPREPAAVLPHSNAGPSAAQLIYHPWLLDGPSLPASKRSPISPHTGPAHHAASSDQVSLNDGSSSAPSWYDPNTLPNKDSVKMHSDEMLNRPFTAAEIPSSMTSMQQPKHVDAFSPSSHPSVSLPSKSHVPPQDFELHSSGALAPQERLSKPKRKREPSAASKNTSRAQRQVVKPGRERYIRDDEEMKQLMSRETRQLVQARIRNRELRATRASRAPPAVLTPKQQALRDSPFATDRDREDFDSQDGNRFWLACNRVSQRRTEAKNMSPEEQDAFLARLANHHQRQADAKKRTAEERDVSQARLALDRPRPRPHGLTKKRRLLQESEYFKLEDQADVDSKDPERSRRAWQRVRGRISEVARKSRLEQARQPKPRAEVPKDVVEVQRASTLALKAAEYPAPLWVSQAQHESHKAVRVESPRQPTDLDSDSAFFAHLLDQGLIGTPEHSAQTSLHHEG